MKPTRCVLPVLCLFLLAFSPASSRTSPPQSGPMSDPCVILPPNGGFESGTLDGFSLAPGTQAQVLSSFGSTAPSQGNSFCLLTQNGGPNTGVGIEAASVSIPAGSTTFCCDMTVLVAQVPTSPLLCVMRIRNSSTGETLGTAMERVPAAALSPMNQPTAGFGLCSTTMTVQETVCVNVPVDIIVDVAISSDTLPPGDCGCLVDNFCECPVVNQFDCTIVPRLGSFAPWQNAPCG